MNTSYQILTDIVWGESLENKLNDLSQIKIDWNFNPIDLPQKAGRCQKIKYSNEKIKFPKKMTDNLNKAIALNSFANHELLAIEMMALALVYFPHHQDDRESILFKKGILAALKDEQKHFKLYHQRMHELGFDFGDFPLNDFFWNQLSRLTTPEAFSAAMALTFEQANLDFATYYRDYFKSIDDSKTASILDTVLTDEIAHVAIGARYLNTQKNEKSLWEYYTEVLPFPLTPNRAKGKVINLEARKQAGLEQDFIDSLIDYRDGFAITHRKEWKVNE
jgi:uncharacterized ferritin-like protein (DUF455 family)